jgi:hypothetical protein
MYYGVIHVLKTKSNYVPRPLLHFNHHKTFLPVDLWITFFNNSVINILRCTLEARAQHAALNSI